MCILKNMTKGKNKFYSLINIVIMIFMISSTIIFLIIHSSVNKAILKYKNKLDLEVQIAIDTKKLNELGIAKQLSKTKDIFAKDYLKFAKSQYVDKVLFSGNTMVHIDGINEKDSEYELYNTKISVNAEVSGYSDYKSFLEVSNVNIKEGTVFKDDTECVISEAFAQYNMLKIGDELTVCNGIKGEENNSIKLKVVGIYQYILNEDFSVVDTVEFSNVVTTYNSMAKLEEDTGMARIYTKAKFFLKDSSSRENFEKELRDKGLDDIYIVSIDEESYRKYIVPLNHIDNSVFTTVFTMFAIGGILLILNSILVLKKIKYKIVVLRLSGISKLKIAKSFIYQSSIWICIALILGVPLGIQLSKVVFNYIFNMKRNLDVAYILKLSIDDVFAITSVLLIMLILTSVIEVYNIFKYRLMDIISKRD